MNLNIVLIPAVVITASLLTGPAAAAPQIIDETCAQNGCFPGDNPGLPVEIQEPGSYRLGSNLQMGARDAHAIVIESPNVQLDMDGFAILGKNRCEWTEETAACEQPSQQKAAILGLRSAESVAVVNGSIRGIAGSGLRLGATGARVENMLIQEVAGDGIAFVEGGGIVADSIVDRAGHVAIFVPTIRQPVVISRSVVIRSSHAFNAGALDNVVTRNNGQGISNLNAVVDGSVDEFSVVVP